MLWGSRQLERLFYSRLIGLVGRRILQIDALSFYTLCDFPGALGMKRLPFKTVVPVGIPAPQAGNRAGQKIQRREERSPAFVLPNMNLFVDAAPFKAFMVPADNDMPEGQGFYCAIRAAAGQQKRQYAAFNFDDAPGNRGGAAGKDYNRNQQNADAGYRENPAVFEK
jgi:hypothetical protein